MFFLNNGGALPRRRYEVKGHGRGWGQATHQSFQCPGSRRPTYGLPRLGRAGTGTRIYFSALGVDKHHSVMYSAAMLSKELVAASTVPLVLSILGEGESYGYALIQRVRELSGGGI